MKHIALITIGLALALPLHAEEAAAGKGKKGNPEAAFKKRDKDGDGFLSKEEFLAKAKDAEKAGKAFAKKDKDGDGKLSLAEATAKPDKKGGKKNKKP
jgi:Ca2+-binding EF-hand superfamily protein